MSYLNFRGRIPMWKKALKISVFLVILTSASFTYAACTPSQSGIPNPICASSFGELVTTLSTALIFIATPLAVVALIFAGFKFVTASTSGDAKGLQEAKKMFWWILIGTAIIVGASALAKIAVNFAKDL